MVFKTYKVYKIYHKTLNMMMMLLLMMMILIIIVIVIVIITRPERFIMEKKIIYKNTRQE